MASAGKLCFSESGDADSRPFLACSVVVTTLSNLTGPFAPGGMVSTIAFRGYVRQGPGISQQADVRLTVFLRDWVFEHAPRYAEAGPLATFSPLGLARGIWR